MVIVLSPFLLPSILLAFLLGIIDVSFGGGYGTLLTPVLLLVGYGAAEVVPAVLISQLVGDFLAAFFHHKMGNVDLSFGNKSFRVAMALSLFGSLGAVASVIAAVNLPKFFLNMYIGVLVAAIGIFILIYRNREFRFSWNRLVLLGFVAAFNKGISGGGYGPLVAGGQILSGVAAKSAVAITSVAEGITCIIAVSIYFLVGANINYTLSIALSLGIALSAPAAAYIIKKIQNQKFKLILATTTIALGLVTIIQTASI